MLKELSSEEVITQILASREIINNYKKDNKGFFITTPDNNLGDYLENNQHNNFEENSCNIINDNQHKFKKSKYSFINIEKNVKF